MAHHRATRAEIDLTAFRHNLQNLRKYLDPQTRIMAIVKADAYGHGAVSCARIAVESGAANYLGAGVIEEGIELRENGLNAPILILGSIFPDEAEDLVRHNLATILCTQPLAQALSKEAEKQDKTVSVHIKVDTGMNRLGISPENLPALLDQVRNLKNLKIEAVSTHFSSADDEDLSVTQAQLEKFQTALTILQKEGVHTPIVHCANTSALFKFPESHFNMVRPGLILYGVLPSPSLRPVIDQGENPFQPVMQWKSQIILLKPIAKNQPVSYSGSFTTQRDSLIATLPIGYADGLHRMLSNKMDVLIRGRRAPQVGNICMDMILIDVTDIPDVQAGDEVVIFGRQGDEMISVEELAVKGKTIPYEILCSVSKRVPRIYT
ncbi:MAG TPA: alanine racemase [Nitrospinaceae bacterium]|jgi:alanine racemase|nr:alanine racemase [Nitrospinaceae bacterium]HIE80591.1 alanine racemase [Nitrospinaceae bacterium]